MFCENFKKEDVFQKYTQVYEPPRNLIVQLDEIFDCDVNIEYKPVIVYDFESLCLSIEKNGGE